MPGPLNLNALRAVRELQGLGLQLDYERARLWPHTAMSAALSAGLPFSEVGANTFVLYSNRIKRPLGFIQTRPRRGRPEADISFISPSLDAHPDAVTIWYRLLAETTNSLCEQGCQRIFVQVAEGNGEEEVFRQSGFASYAHEAIYVLRPERIKHFSQSSGTRLLRRQRKRDSWYLLRLYNAATPRPVQQAEGMSTTEGKLGKFGDWWEQAVGTGYVLEARDGSLAGAVRVIRGRAADWLRIYLHPDAREAAGELVCGALNLVRTRRPRPVYCAVRDYEGGVRGYLETGGFDFVFKRHLMVKHTTVRIKEPALWAVPALEKPAPIVNSQSRAQALEKEGELVTA